ncbi:MAG: shikimate kinase [Clostridiales bacterium]|nr:shikimate kinase [Clostridiales bacterium]
MKDNIVLIGFMGSGKSSVGIRLAHALGYEFMDTDHYIESTYEKSIKDIFATEGEEAFRKIETDSLKELSKSLHHHVIATGGGMPLREENAALLRQIGTVIFLNASKEEIYSRLKEDTTRPLLAGENPMQRIEALLNARLPIYQKAADATVTTDQRSFYSIIEEIQKSMIK